MVEMDYARIQGRAEPVALPRLFLDDQNPRLSSYEARTQDAILDVLAREMSLGELALSIAANGFYETERLLVVPREEDTYTVVEGNRRLAAVQLLLDEKKRQKTKTTDFPIISLQLRQDLKTLPVSVFQDRKQLWPYLGFRHVNGPRDWDSFAKAQYIADVHEKYGIPIEEITERIGDQFSTATRMYLGYRLVRQAQDAGVFSAEDRYYEKRFYFSHLYTAADSPGYQRFLGITKSTVGRRNPVPRKFIPQLGELLLWIYGSKKDSVPPIVRSQNPDLMKLRQAIADPQALQSLRQGNFRQEEALDRAIEIAQPDDKLLRDNLEKAKYDLREANKFVTLGFKGEKDLQDLADEVYKLALGVQQRMNDFHLAGKRQVG